MANNGWVPRVKKVLLLTGIGLLTLNLWTGSPVLALWIGARVQGSGPPSMGAIAVVALVLAVLSGVLVRLIAHLNHSYDQLTGRRRNVRRHVPWLRSLRGERPHDAAARDRVSSVDVILISMAVAAIALFEVWFFFFSGSPLSSVSGR